MLSWVKSTYQRVKNWFSTFTAPKPLLTKIEPIFDFPPLPALKPDDLAATFTDSTAITVETPVIKPENTPQSAITPKS